MRPIRSTLATLACTGAILAGTTGVASAQQLPIEGAVDTSCDTASGDYVVTLTIDDNEVIDFELDGSFEAFEGETEIDSGSLTFDPAPLPGSGTSTATFNVPGTTTSVWIDYGFDYEGRFDDNVEIELEGDCVAAETTTTAAPTTTSAAAAVAATVAPRFTG